MTRPNRIHVVGSSPRSGTTLAFELLTSCFEIDKFGDHEISLFEQPRNPQRDFVSKKPTDMVHVKRLLDWDKKLHCLFLDRDPRDIVVSQHGSRPGEYWCDFPAWYGNRRMADQLAGHPRFYICRYEDLVTDPDAEQARIVAAFPFLKIKHDFRDFEKVTRSSKAAQDALKGVRKISARSVGAWRNDLPRVAAQLHAHPRMAQHVVSAGYAENTDWVDTCKDVPPSAAESVRARHNALRDKQGPALLVARLRRRLRSLTLETRYALRSLIS